MREKNRINCPDSHLPRDERIKYILNEFDRWLSIVPFSELVWNYGGELPKEASAVDKVVYLKESFVDIWDYRKRQKEALTSEGEAARWLLENSEREIKNSELILETARELGLIGVTKTILVAPDYYLPLGGAKMSNLYRCLIAAKESERIGRPARVVALSAMRPISESERESVDTYAPGAITEYDAISAGMKNAFQYLSEDGDDSYTDDTNPNLSYCIRKFTGGKEGGEFYALAAPSSDPSRRANSDDCFKFFFDRFEVEEHSQLVNCTSQIYCPYQQVRALSYAIDHNVVFDTIGFRLPKSELEAAGNAGLSKPVNYLQEMKSTIDAMYSFVKRYC